MSFTQDPTSSDCATMARAFRDSEPGQLWQQKQFAAALSFVGPHCDAASLAAARAHLRREAPHDLPQNATVADAVLDDFLRDMQRGALCRQEMVARVTQLIDSAPYDAAASLTRQLRSEFLASLLPLHPVLRDLFLRDMRQFLPPSTALERSTAHTVA